MARIPAEVWRFCAEQVKLHPLNEIAYRDQLREIREVYTNSGTSGRLDQSGVIIHTGAAPQEIQYERQEAALQRPHFRYLSRCVAIMEAVAMDPELKVILNAIWTNGWRDNSLIALEANVSPRSVARLKHEIIKRIATGWGLW